MLLGSDSGLEGGCGSSSSSRRLLGAPEVTLGMLADRVEDVEVVEEGEGGLEGDLRVTIIFSKTITTRTTVEEDA